MDEESRAGGWDRRIAALAHRQHGVVARRQLLELGLRRGAIGHRIAAGRLHRVHQGVYAVGHAGLTVRGRWMAAVLTAWPGALLSHRSAGQLWDLPVFSAVPEIIVTGYTTGGPRGIRRRSTRTLAAEDFATRNGIPVTALPRTLLDLAEVVSFGRLERAVEQADRMQLLDLAAIDGVCARNPGRRGLRPLRGLLVRFRGAPDVRSELERRFLDLCRRYGIPQPATNVVVAGLVVDAFWPREGLVAELDGYRWHRGRSAFEEDRRRTAILELAGYRVLRITARRLADEPAKLAADVRAYLAMAEGGSRMAPHPRRRHSP